jgi:site-specific DNA-methyltransferase (adenine-specific)
MEIINMKTGDLIPYENNPRNNDEAVEYVANSIREFGFKVPIVVDKDNVIVAGHTRLKAAQLLGLEEVPVVVADDLTPEQVKAFRLADNKTGELAEWDFDLLDLELDGIADIDMEQFGFGEPEFGSDDDYLKEQTEPEAKEGNKCTCPNCGFTFETL